VRSKDRVEIDGKAFTCSVGEGFQPGQNVLVGLRPETIRVRGVTGKEANALKVRIDDLEFLGAFCRAELVEEGLQALHLIADFSANLIGDLGLAQGGSLFVELPADALMIFPGRSQA